MAYRARRDAQPCLAADPCQPHHGGDPGDRCGADGMAGGAAARRSSAWAQPELRVQPDLPRPRHRILADDGDRARCEAALGAAGTADISPVAVDGCDGQLADLADPLELGTAHTRAWAGTGACPGRRALPSRLHVVDAAFPAVPGDAQLRVG